METVTDLIKSLFKLWLFCFVVGFFQNQFTEDPWMERFFDFGAPKKSSLSIPTTEDHYTEIAGIWSCKVSGRGWSRTVRAISKTGEMIDMISPTTALYYVVTELNGSTMSYTLKGSAEITDENIEWIKGSKDFIQGYTFDKNESTLKFDGLREILVHDCVPSTSQGNAAISHFERIITSAKENLH